METDANIVILLISWRRKLFSYKIGATFNQHGTEMLLNEHGNGTGTIPKSVGSVVKIGLISSQGVPWTSHGRPVGGAEHQVANKYSKHFYRSEILEAQSDFQPKLGRLRSHFWEKWILEGSPKSPF